MRKVIFCLLPFVLLMGCASTKYRKIGKEIELGLGSELLRNQFTGFFLMDADSRDTIYRQNAQRYFTPASNTKIFTLYTGLSLLPKQIPALKYLVKDDSLYIEGTGDPTLLHPYFQDSTAIDFLEGYDNIVLYLNNFQSEKFGPGWAWDDFSYYYQAERSALPLYGNVTNIFNHDSIQVVPSYFKGQVIDLDHTKNREEGKNVFYYDTSRKDTTEIPFRVDSTLTRKLLEEALEKKVSITDRMPKGEKSVIYSLPSDTVYKRMMEVSDNFLAEQLLVLAAATLSDTLDVSMAQKHMIENQLADLGQSPRWVDGSGLSRYNLFTPESIAHVLFKMYREVPRERLFSLFPVGGVGTLEGWYAGDDRPYVYAKSGSLGNNYCLSGYLLTKSSKTLVFSFMNNHFMTSSGDIKKHMELILERIRDTY